MAKTAQAAPAPSKAAPADDMVHVRIKPYDPKRGHRLRVFIHGPTGKRFDEKKGWYRVPRHVAMQLAEIHVNEADDRSPFAFDVMSAEEAKRVDQVEKKIAEKRALAEEPNDLGTKDLHRRPADHPQEVPPDDRHAATRGARPERTPRSMRPAGASDDVDPFET